MEKNLAPTGHEKGMAGTAFKSLSITMGDDGKPKILVNGEEVPNMTSASFYMYNEPYYKSVSFDYSTCEKAEPGEMAQHTRHSYVAPQQGCAAVIKPSETANASASVGEHTAAGKTTFSQM